MLGVKKEEYFIKLPNSLVWVYEEGESPLIQELNSKTVMVLSNLFFRCNAIGECYFTLEDLITSFTYKPRTGKGNINEQFKNILLDLQKLKFITNTNVDLREIKINTLIKCEMQSNIITKDGKDKQFFRVFYNDYQKIMAIDTKLDKSILFNTYCYINARITHRAKDEETITEYGTRNFGKGEYTFFKYEDIVRDLNISETTFKDHLEVLKVNKLVFFGNIGLIEKDGNRRMANNIYTIKECEFEISLSDSRFYYEREGYRILGRKTDEGIKKIIGLSSRINQLKEQGYDTTKNEKKLIKLEIDKAYKEDTRTEEKVLEDVKKLIKKMNYGKVKTIVEDFEKDYCKLAEIKGDKKLLVLLEKKLKVS